MSFCAFSLRQCGGSGGGCGGVCDKNHFSSLLSADINVCVFSKGCYRLGETSLAWSQHISVAIFDCGLCR